MGWMCSTDGRDEYNIQEAARKSCKEESTSNSWVWVGK
jgi:hypothetical protein